MQEGISTFNLFLFITEDFPDTVQLGKWQTNQHRANKKKLMIYYQFFFLSQAETRNCWRETQPKSLSNFKKKRTKKPEDMSYNSCKWWCHFNNQQNMFNVQLQLTPRNMVTRLSRHSMLLDAWKAEACTRYKAKMTPVLERSLQLSLVFDYDFFW